MTEQQPVDESFVVDVTIGVDSDVALADVPGVGHRQCLIDGGRTIRLCWIIRQACPSIRQIDDLAALAAWP